MPTYMNSVGYAITLNVDLDISDSTVRKILYKKPSGATGFWIAALQGLFELCYLVQEGALDEAGRWEVQAYVEMPTGRALYGEITYLDVEANIRVS